MVTQMLHILQGGGGGGLGGGGTLHSLVQGPVSCLPEYARDLRIGDGVLPYIA